MTDTSMRMLIKVIRMIMVHCSATTLIDSDGADDSIDAQAIKDSPVNRIFN